MAALFSGEKVFTDKTKELINKAILSEYENAKEKYGSKYNSMHEGYAVIKEEIEEAMAEMTGIFEGLEAFWDHVKQNNVLINDITIIQNKAIYTALEICQVAAVCEKIINTIPGDNHN